MSNVETVEILSSLSLSVLADLFNDTFADDGEVYGLKPIKKFASKKAAVDRLSALIEEHGLELTVTEYSNGGVDASIFAPVEDPHAASNALISAAVAAGDLDLPEVTEVEIVEEPAAEEPAAEVPFVKLSKEELAALGERGTPAREAYRKARRAAARAARKAKEAAASA